MEINRAVVDLETTTGKTFGRKQEGSTSGTLPLLLCVRSEKGDKKLSNLGMNDVVAQTIRINTGKHFNGNIVTNRNNKELLGDKHFSLDLYRHFLAMFGVTVLKVHKI